MTRGRLIVLTGLDASGKDFVAQWLHAQDPTSSLIQTPTEVFRVCRRDLDMLAVTSPAVHYFFYLSSVIHASQLIENMLPHGNVYCIRYLIDTVVYHRALGLPVELDYETPLYRIKPPDETIFLAVDNEGVRQQRLEQRGVITAGDLLVNDDEFRKSLMYEYNQFARHFTAIDNTNRQIVDVVSEITDLLQLP